MISVEGLVKSYGGDERAVDDLSFTVREGEFYTLLGPSGCGKTTTLKCVAGLEHADAGTIALGDTVVVSDRVFVPTHRRDIGMVFQNYAVWPHLNVYDNVAFPLRVSEGNRSRRSHRDRVMAALDLVDLGGLEHRMSTELSGGQQQRLSLARALVREPQVLLLDEPLSNLDAKLRESMRTELSLIQRRLGITALFVTHDQVEALAMSDRIAVMRGGKIVQEGAPRQIYHEPVDEFVASFVGSTNLFAAELAEVVGPDSSRIRVTTRFGELECPSPSGQTGGLFGTGTPLSVVVRPEDVRLHSAGSVDRTTPNLFPGRLEIGQFAGPFVEYRVTLDSGVQITAMSSSREDLTGESDIMVELPAAGCRALTRSAGADAVGTSERTPGAQAAT